MGASHVNRGIDVDFVPSGYNLSKPSERYLFTYLKLQKLIENNPQVKTIVLECAPTDLWQNSDDKYFVDNEMSEFVPLFYPLFNIDVIKDYRGHYFDMVKFIIQHLLDVNDYRVSKYLKRIGYGYQENNLLEEQMDISKVCSHIEQGVYGNQLNWKYLHKIIDYCNQNSLKLYLVYFPMFHPEFFYDQEYFYNKIKKLEQIDFLDYSHYSIPDSCRYDAHHLNKKGAELFTKQLIKDLHLY